MTVYDAYAPIYDAIGQDRFGAELAARILAALPEPPRRALDLACGTGAAALTFAAGGVTTVGVDRAEAMLARARAKACARGLSVTFINADVRQLPSDERLAPRSFDLITCLADSLNYLTGDDDLALVLTNAARLLRPGGRLIFDLNTEYQFLPWGEGLDQVEHDADGILVCYRLRYDSAARLAHGRVIWFVRVGERWRRYEEQHTERAWRDDEVCAAIAAAGLRLIARRTPEWEPAPPDAPRIVYDTALDE